MALNAGANGRVKPRPLLMEPLLIVRARRTMASLVRRWSSCCRVHRGHRVLLSSSRDAFANLAAEEVLYRRREEGDPPLLLLWRNDPCVVIGRHQIPWLECGLEVMGRRGVACARRHSGGGAVFHDAGNLNCTFFGRRADYDRKANLSLVRDAIGQRWPELDLSLNDRDDILLDGLFKISGTAAKLGHKNAYHHCTVLFDADKRLLSSVLKRRDQIEGLESKATESVASPVKNLSEADSSVCFEALVEAIGGAFSRRFGVDPGSSGIPVVRPDEDTFPGISAVEEQLRSWDWVFGKSPRFGLSVRCLLPPRLRGFDSPAVVRFELRVFRGIVEEARFEPDDWMSEASSGAMAGLTGTRFPVGGTLAADGERWDQRDARQREEKSFIAETIARCASALQ